MSDKNKKKTLVRGWLATRMINIIALVVIITIVAYMRPVAAFPVFLVALFGLFYDYVIHTRENNAIREGVETIVGGMSDINSIAVNNNPVPMCLIGEEGNILWRNESFLNLFPKGSAMTDDIMELTGMKLQKLSNEELKEKVVLIASLNRSFRVQYSEAKLPGLKKASSEESADGREKLRMLHWVEITTSLAWKKSYRDERVCMAHIIIDNLDDILLQAPEDKKASLAVDIEKNLRQWAIRYQGALVRTSKNRYTLVCDYRNLENMTANKFQILDEIRAMDTGADIPASLSIGFGAQGKSISQTEEFASAALELAQGRGGDQTVVKKGTNIEYFGGKLITVEKRNKGKSRIVALALRRLIDLAPQVFIMGHKLPDMDSLGAALGIARMAMNRGKQVHIIIDSWDAVQMLYDLARKENPELFIHSDIAKQVIEKEDLLVVVDTSKPSVAECGELIEMTERVVVIDHHRRGTEMIQNPLLVHIEPYASSTSELVAEMLQYTSSEKKGLTHVEAEGLLSGITVDSKNFSVKTGVRTFEAAAWLRRQGADTTLVRQFFQTDMELFRKKAQIIANAEQLPNDVAVSYCEGKQPNISVLISMAADELLDIRGMKASFVIGRNDDGSLRISARSLGEVNVQRIMEELGGGGNLTTAGARLEDMTMEDGMELLKKTIQAFLSENNKKQQTKGTKEIKEAKEN